LAGCLRHTARSKYKKRKTWAFFETDFAIEMRKMRDELRKARSKKSERQWQK
jgi:hypothetical protein